MSGRCWSGGCGGRRRRRGWCSGAGGGSNAVKIVSYAYDPYGNIRSAPGLDEPLAWWNTLTWTGAPRDLQTGLYRLGVRWYDPVTGRFTTPDPTAQETNPYAYAGGNPSNRIDPTGGGWGENISLAAGVVGLAALGVGAVTASPLIATAAATVGVYAGIVGVASTAACHSSIRNERSEC